MIEDNHMSAGIGMGALLLGGLLLAAMLVIGVVVGVVIATSGRRRDDVDR
jgi:hypothetical protein